MAMRVAKIAMELAKQQGGPDHWRQHIVLEGLGFRHWDSPYTKNIDDVRTYT
jgi:hypothetical protein